MSVIAIFSILDGYCLLYLFQLLNWDCLGTTLLGDNCFVFVFGLFWFGFGWVVWLQPKKLVQILEAKKRLAMEAQVCSSNSSRTTTHQQKKQQQQQQKKKKKKKTSFCCAFCRVLGCVKMSIGVNGNNAAGHPTLLVFVAAAHCLRFLSVLQIFWECNFLLLFFPGSAKSCALWCDIDSERERERERETHTHTPAHAHTHAHKQGEVILGEREA